MIEETFYRSGWA